MKIITYIISASICFLFSSMGIVSAQISDSNAFVTVWNTGNATEINFPGVGNNYTIKVYNADDPTGATPIQTVTDATSVRNTPYDITGLSTNSNYRFEVTPGLGSFTSIYSFDYQLGDKLLEVRNWGNIQWLSMNSAFQFCSNMHITADDTPNLSSVTDFYRTFRIATSMNENIGDWDVSNGKTFQSMFSDASSFNQDIGNWDVSSGTNFQDMFAGAQAFNQYIGNWDVSNGTNFKKMFSGASSFNQNIGNWDVSKATNFSQMFAGANAFNQYIGGWDVSNGTNFSQMFADANAFNQYIGNWDVGNGIDFSGMFSSVGFTPTSFNQDIGGWDVSNGSDFSSMFSNSLYNKDIGDWDVGNGTDFGGMFNSNKAFNQDIGGWDVSKGTDFEFMFYRASSFNQDIGDWNVSNGTRFRFMFSDASAFNQDIGSWNVSKGTNFRAMFYRAQNFNKDIGNWNVSNGTDFSLMFQQAVTFNQDIGSWNVSKGYSFREMFQGAKAFNQDIGSWDVSNGSDFYGMFQRAEAFNQDIGSWDVSKANNFVAMFKNAKAFNQDIGDWNVSRSNFFVFMFEGAISFNQDLGSWDVSNAISLRSMFDGASSFNQNLGNWNLKNIQDIRYMLSNTAIDCKNYSATLIGWAENPQTKTPGYDFGNSSLIYNSNALEAHNILEQKGWTLRDRYVADCRVGEIINVTSPAPLEVCITAPATPICSGETTTLTVEITGGTPSYTLTYDGSTTTLTNVSGDGETPTASFELTTGALATTTVFDGSNIIVSDANGCAVSYTCTATVEVRSLPDDSFTLEDALACPSSLVTLTLSGSEVGVNYQLQTVTPTVNIGNPISGTGTPLFFVVNSGTNSETYQVSASYDNASNCSVILNTTAAVELINASATVDLNDENIIICQLPQRILNLNEYVTYSSTSTYDIDWFEAISMNPVSGDAFNTGQLGASTVNDYIYRVTEEICGNEIYGEGHLYIKTVIMTDGLKDKSVEYCYTDADNINLNVIKEFESVGTWEMLNISSNIASNYLNEFRFNGKEAYSDGISVDAQGVAIYNFKFTVTEANGCLQIGDSCTVTIIITN